MVRLQHIYREANQVVDWLANLAITKDDYLYVLTNPPDGLKSVLLTDNHDTLYEHAKKRAFIKCTLSSPTIPSTPHSSKTTTTQGAHEKNYSIHDLELVAVVFVLKIRKHYLYSENMKSDITSTEELSDAKKKEYDLSDHRGNKCRVIFFIKTRELMLQLIENGNEDEYEVSEALIPEAKEETFLTLADEDAREFPHIILEFKAIVSKLKEYALSQVKNLDNQSISSEVDEASLAKRWGGSSHSLQRFAMMGVGISYQLALVGPRDGRNFISTNRSEAYFTLPTPPRGDFLAQESLAPAISGDGDVIAFLAPLASLVGGRILYEANSLITKNEYSLYASFSTTTNSRCKNEIDQMRTLRWTCHSESKHFHHRANVILSLRKLFKVYMGGLTLTCSSALYLAIIATFYECVTGIFLPLLPEGYQSVAHCMAGGCSSVATSFIFTPSECIKQQMQVGTHYQNSWSALLGILQKGGLPSLYAGWTAVLCRNIPHSIIKFYTYEKLKQLIQSPAELNSPPNTFQMLLCGGLAGSTAALFTTPFDVVKTRLQTQIHLQQIPGSLIKYEGVLDALQEIFKHEGLKGLYRGLTPRLIMYVSQGAIFFASYEFFKSVLCLKVQRLHHPATNEKENTEDDSAWSLVLPPIHRPS
ncbi:hypothetical protein Sjap_020880 [Stephania japonica]|uniref:Uncharacterized protein n=1 Tax=Stephania japonica TaxID=461633 RepID=A0AAP0F1K0_9MAGN